MLLASLMYATDKIANTVGHFEHFLSKKPADRGVVLRLPNIEVPEEARGCYDLVTEAYLKYGVEQGLIKIDKE